MEKVSKLEMIVIAIAIQYVVEARSISKIYI